MPTGGHLHTWTWAHDTELLLSDPCADAFGLCELGLVTQPLWASVSLSEKWEWFGGAVSEIIRDHHSGNASCCYCAQWGAVPRPSLGFLRPSY